MKIGILSRNKALYSTRRLVQAGRVRGHQVTVIDTLSIPVKIGRPMASPFESLPKVDAIIPRIGTSITFYGLAVVRQFEAKGILATATAEAIAQSRDKLNSLQLMNRAGLPIPNTAVVAEPVEAWQAVEMAGGLPVIIKLIRGTQGRGVFLASTVEAVIEVSKFLRRVQEQMLVQEFIEESSGSDIRVIVVGNRCVAAMRRQAADGEFRSNLHLGGSASKITLDQETKSLAARAAKLHGLDLAGVDLVQSDRGPLLLEVNSSPGLEGIEKATGVDVASEIIAHLERQWRRHKHRRQKKVRQR